MMYPKKRSLVSHAHVRSEKSEKESRMLFKLLTSLHQTGIFQITFLEEKHLWKFEFKKLLRLANDYNEIVTAMTKKKKEEEAMTKKKREKMFCIVLNTLKALSTNVR
jgi:hypothetical protein